MTDLLAGTGFAGWDIQPMSGDASSRRYARLIGPDGSSAILMDASAEPPAPFSAFQRIGAHLRDIGLAAPKVFHVNDAQRLLVLEDLGAFQFARWLTHHPSQEEELYAAAVDVMIRLQSRKPPTDLVSLDPTHAAGMIGPVFEWYLLNVSDNQAAHIIDLLRFALWDYAGTPDCLALRDFHADNLIWRPSLRGTDRVGLLDFQDAVCAPPTYDLVSLLRDARRDVSRDTRNAMFLRFSAATGSNTEDVATAAAVLGVQRNLRIIGIFARLARRDGKTRYLDLMPRVLAHVHEDLTHPALTNLHNALAEVLPPPARGAV
ncbi:MAG: phosphotransferase [Rhodobacterales bacterium]|nr:phosphotransferase [Rhodobacterales bacterium]